MVLTQEQELLQGTVREFSHEQISSVASKIDSESRVPEELFQKLPDLGLYGIVVPSEYGGASADYVSLLLAVEELSKVSATVGARVCFQGIVCETLKSSSNESLKTSLFPKLAGGSLAAFSVDPNSTITWRKDSEGGLVLNGSSEYVVNADSASIFLVRARSKEGSNILVSFQKEEASRWVEIGEPKKLMGLRGSGTCRVSLNGLKLLNSSLAFDANSVPVGLDVLLIASRLGVAAQALGIAQASLDEEVRYANERSQFNTKIGRFYAVQDFIASDKVSIETARGFTYGIASHAFTEESVKIGSCIAKISASSAAVQSARHSIRVHGGYGFIRDYPVERYLRDARVTLIYLEPNEVLKAKIAEELIR